MKDKRKCGFEARERLGGAYWKDKRWKRVRYLRNRDRDTEANSLVIEIRASWGID